MSPHTYIKKASRISINYSEVINKTDSHYKNKMVQHKATIQTPTMYLCGDKMGNIELKQYKKCTIIR